jgi:TPP-dependent pyruvate/acetoin dehydrogenase alpha subunit
MKAPEDLLKLPGFGEKKIETIRKAAQDFVQQQTEMAKNDTEPPPQEG